MTEPMPVPQLPAEEVETPVHREFSHSAFAGVIATSDEFDPPLTPKQAEQVQELVINRIIGGLEAHAQAMLGRFQTSEHMPAWDYPAWAEYGQRAGWAGKTVCSTHDGVPMSESEDQTFEDGDDPCIHIIRLYQTPETRTEVEASIAPQDRVEDFS